MNNTDELIEEINDVILEVGNQSKESSEIDKIEPNVLLDNQTANNEVLSKPSTTMDNVTPKVNSTDVANDELIVPPIGEYVPSKSKTPLLIILSILLVLDIAALIIYIIGIDKVLNFIK